MFYDPVKRIVLRKIDAEQQIYQDEYQRYYIYKHGLYTPRLEVEVAAELRPLEVNSASTIIVQGDYMSGDRYGIAAALTFDDTLGVLIITSNETLAKGVELLKFYRQVLEVQHAYPLRATLYNAGERTPQEVYAQRNDFAHSAFEDSIQPEAKVIEATFGTKKVSEALRTYGAQGEEGTQAYFAQKVLNENEAGELRDAKAIQDFLTRRGLHPGRYAFIWVKTGSFAAEKAYHFADPTGVTQMIKSALAANRIPVLIGDQIEPPKGHWPSQTVLLWNFWDQGDFPLKQEGRIGQLKFYRYLTTAEGYDVINIGMRSGGMEGPALVGMPTIYLEEMGSSQAVRMEQWLEHMPNFYRIIIYAPAGAMQKTLLAQVLRQRVALIRDDNEQEMNRFLIALASGNPADFLTYKDQYIKFIEQEICLLELSALAEEGFTEADMNAMFTLLNLEKLDLQEGRIPQLPNFAHKNSSFAERFLSEMQKKPPSKEESSSSIERTGEGEKQETRKTMTGSSQETIPVGDEIEGTPGELAALIKVDAGSLGTRLRANEHGVSQNRAPIFAAGGYIWAILEYSAGAQIATRYKLRRLPDNTSLV